MSARVRLRAGLLWAMGVCLAAGIGSVVLHDASWGPAAQGVFGLLTAWLPVAVCWLAVSRVGFRRWEVLLAAAAATAFAAGLTSYLWMLSTGGPPPFPSVSDAPYLVFYPLMLAALVVAVRHHVRGLASSVWLDSAVGSLGAAAVLAVLLSPVLESALTASSSFAAAVAIAYPMFDLLLVATVAGIAALRDVHVGSRWGLLVVGLLVFAASDVVYALQRAEGVYVVGTPLDAGWAIGLALMTMWVDGAQRPDGSAKVKARPEANGTALAVSAVATTAGLAVLVVSSRAPLSTRAWCWRQ